MADEQLTQKPTAEERVKLRRDLRRMKPFVWMLRIPGVLPLLTRRLRQCDSDISPELLRWLVRTGYPQLERALQSPRPQSVDELLDALASARPAPPPGFRAIVERYLREGDTADANDLSRA